MISFLFLGVDAQHSNFDRSYHYAALTDCADDARATELGWRAVLCVERRQPLHAGSAILLMHE